MSGGFFRGTSADQDTRFSNKQAKLLKSQKFAPELENLVDMTKVKMDVMRPWIAKRVTELIGFEDEVLINFIDSLLEGKGVNGKQVQISLTGFMERNTGKFMKELWSLLLSAQQNLSGVPQQFLDVKEEETKKKKAETDRIANEIQRKKEKEKQEVELEKTKMDGDGAMPTDKHTDLELNVKHGAKGSSIWPADKKEQYKRNGQRRRSRGSESPDSSYDSPSLRFRHPASPSRSSNYSDDRQRSRSASRAPPSRSRSISSERRLPSPRWSGSPRRRHIVRRSPSPWRRSLRVRRRSTSHSRRRSPSPARYRVRSPRRHRSRSPLRRRSRSSVRRRSRTPIRRSPVRYRSRTPLRCRSPLPMRHRSSTPMQGRSPSPIRGRSPSFVRRRSPSAVRRSPPSPIRRRSSSPLRGRSSSPLHQSPSPARRRYRRSPSTPRKRSISPIRRRSSLHGRKRSPVRQKSPSPQSSYPSHIHRSSLSPVRRGSLQSARSPIQAPGRRVRGHEKYSLARRASPDERAELTAENREGRRSVERRPIVSLRSPQRDMLDGNDIPGKERELSRLQKSPHVLDSSRGRSYSEERRSTTPRGSSFERREKMARPESPNPSWRNAGRKPSHDSSGTSADDKNVSSREIGEYNRSSEKMSPVLVCHKDLLDSAEIHGLADGTKSRKTPLPNRGSDRMDHKEHREREGLSSTTGTTDLGTTDLSVKRREPYDYDGAGAMDKKIGRLGDSKGGYQFPEVAGLAKLSGKSDHNDRNGSVDSPSKENEEHRVKTKEKRKHKKSDRQHLESDDYSSSDSYEERKEAKRKRKEEKKLKKEDRRRRREKRRRRRDERHSEKLKLKSGDAGSLLSDLERDRSEDESVRRESRASNIQETEFEQKKLEIELREKALESLRAKKGFGN